MRSLCTLLLAVALTACASIGPANMIPVDQAEDATVLVCDEHDQYVRNDDNLTPDAQALYLSGSVLLRGLMQGSAEFVAADTYEEAFEPVAQRYDAYVDADTSLLPNQKVNFRRTTSLLRSLIAEAKN